MKILISALDLHEFALRALLRVRTDAKNTKKVTNIKLQKRKKYLHLFYAKSTYENVAHHNLMRMLIYQKHLVGGQLG